MTPIVHKSVIANYNFTPRLIQRMGKRISVTCVNKLLCLSSVNI